VVICRLKDEAYGLAIRDAIEETTGKRFSIGGIYAPLDRMVKKGLLSTEEGLPTQKRQGRRRRRYVITNQGLAVLRDMHTMHQQIWSGLPKGVFSELEVR